MCMPVHVAVSVGEMALWLIEEIAASQIARGQV